MTESTDILLKQAVEAIAEGRVEALTAEMATTLLDRYPYFTLPTALLIKNAGDSLDKATREQLSHAVAMSASDPKKLYMLLSPGNDAHADFYPDDTPAKPSTDNAIDSFLNTYGTTSPEEEALLNRLIFNPAPDYAQVLANEEAQSIPQADEAPKGSQDDIINRFIIGQKQEATASPNDAPVPEELVRERHSEVAPKAPTDMSLLSESLARIFIKQRQYSRAYEIIEQLNLNYPEKSVYFADQLRFLQKLIKNQENRAKRDAKIN